MNQGTLSLALCMSLWGCGALDHTNTLLFATNTNLGIQAGTDANQVPSVNIGYRRQEAVIMPLAANVKDSQNRRLPCFTSIPEGSGGNPPANATTITVPSVCKFVAKNSNGNLEDSYSVLASFGANFSAQANGMVAEGRGGLAQYFATGAAAQLLAATGGAAVVAVSGAAQASASQPKAATVAAVLGQTATEQMTGLEKISTCVVSNNMVDTTKLKSWATSAKLPDSVVMTLGSVTDPINLTELLKPNPSVVDALVATPCPAS